MATLWPDIQKFINKNSSSGHVLVLSTVEALIGNSEQQWVNMLTLYVKTYIYVCLGKKKDQPFTVA